MAAHAPFWVLPANCGALTATPTPCDGRGALGETGEPNPRPHCRFPLLTGAERVRARALTVAVSQSHGRNIRQGGGWTHDIQPQLNA